MTPSRRDFLKMTTKGALGAALLHRMVLPRHIDAMDGGKTNVLFIAVEISRGSGEWSGV